MKNYTGDYQKQETENLKTEKQEFVNTEKPMGKVNSVFAGRKGLLLTGAILIVIIGVIAAGILFINGKLNKLDYHDGKLEEPFSGELTEEDLFEVDTSGLEMVDDLEPLPELDIIEDSGVINILLLGTDERDSEFSDSARSDAILILSLNINDNTAKLVSVERGLGVPIIEGDHEGENDLITHCFRWGGADLVMKELQACLRIKLERYVRVNLNSFIKIVDTIGGIDLELTDGEAWYINQVAMGNPVGGYKNHGYYRPENGLYEWPDLHEGVNHLNGTEALSFARIRYLDSDWQRIERQRKVIQACVNQIKDSDISTLNELLNEILPMVRTNFTKAELAALMLEAPGFLGVQFEQMTIPAPGTYNAAKGISGSTMYAPIFEENAKILQEFFYGKVAE